MGLDLDPGAVSCSECGDSITSTGYLPATETGEGYEPRPAAAVCGNCGFNEVGMTGCAPELDDLGESGDDVLLHVRPTDEGFDVVSAKS